MKYRVKKGYSYVDPLTRNVTPQGEELDDAKGIDKTQLWKLIGTVVQEPAPPNVATKSFDDLLAQRKALEAKKVVDKETQHIANHTKSDTVKKPKIIDYDKMVED